MWSTVDGKGGNVEDGNFGQRRNGRIPAFSVLLVAAVLVFIGMLVVPSLNVQYVPQVSGREVNVSFSWSGSSAAVVEQNVTSRIEAALGVLPGCEEVSSVSEDGHGTVSLRFGKGCDMEALRFEMASIIRNLYDEFPMGVSCPELSRSVSRGDVSLVCVVQSDRPLAALASYAQNHIVPDLARVEGMRQVSLSGYAPEEWIVCFNPGKLALIGIGAEDLGQAIRDYFRQDLVGMANRVSEGREEKMVVKLKGSDGFSWDRIPVSEKGGRIYYLSDVAEVRKQERKPEQYFRINGLNTLTLSLSLDETGNILRLADKAREEVARVAQGLPSDISIALVYDASEYVAQELNRIYFRTLLCVLVLLLFVYAVSRSWRYLLVIFLSLLVNVFVAFIVYKIIGLGIHIYSLAGITVSLSIIIDTAIVMADHYSYHHDRKAAFPILGAIATTIGALIVIWVLPEEQRLNLLDFAIVIAVNLTVSFFVAFYFVPALLEKWPLKMSVWKRNIRQLRRLVRFNHGYAGFIRWGCRHRWIFVAVLVLGFGIPLFLLPARIETGDEAKAVALYNRVMDLPWVKRNRVWLEKVVGGSSCLFYNSIRYNSLFRDLERPSLSIVARMPENCTLEQMDAALRKVEEKLAAYPLVESFQTSIRDVDNARIHVFFKSEAEETDFPVRLKREISAFVHDMGAAGWYVDGVDNQPYVDMASKFMYAYSIRLTGYDYARLLAYADVLMDSMAQDARVAAVGLADHRELPKDEYYVSYDKERLAALNLSEANYYGLLDNWLYQQDFMPVFVDGEWTPVRIQSVRAESFDLWHVSHAPVDVGGHLAKFSEAGDIRVRSSGMPIRRSNQSYELEVGLDYMGNPDACSRFVEKLVRIMNSQVLPIGFKAERTAGMSEENRGAQVWVLFLVAFVVYWICSVLFDSLRRPLVIVLLIPVSFIGVFLTFGLTDFVFDQGGFAAMVLLSGIVVNAGIYLVCEEMGWGKRTRQQGISLYLKSFHHKIIPILLTVLSTVLGLLPFLHDGPEEVFWFPFAVTVIGGISFSMVALLAYLPVFLLACGNRETEQARLGMPGRRTELMDTLKSSSCRK